MQILVVFAIIIGYNGETIVFYEQCTNDVINLKQHIS